MGISVRSVAMELEAFLEWLAHIPTVPGWRLWVALFLFAMIGLWCLFGIVLSGSGGGK